MKRHNINIGNDISQHKDNMPFQKGNKLGNRFNSDNQPEENGIKKGSHHRSTIPKQILAMKGLYPDKVFEVLKQTYPELEKDMTVEQMLYITQLDKAIKEKDTQAANFIITSAHGQAKQEIDLDNRKTITIKIE